MKIEISDSQLWLVSRALVMLSSEAGETQLRTEYPNLDPEELAADFEDLVEKLHKASGVPVKSASERKE